MRLRNHLLALSGIALVAFCGVESPHFGTLTFLAGLVGLASIGALLLRIRPRTSTTTAVIVGAPPARADKLLTSKRVLVAMLALGIAAYAGGRGTFATFNAETSNLGNSAASGTLTMSDTVGANTCSSLSATTQDNSNTESPGFDANACAVALTLTNLAPGVYGGSAKVSVANTGSIDASKLYVMAPYVNTTYNGGSNLSGSPGTITVTPLEGAIWAGDSITLSWGINSQVCTVSTAAHAAATSITISSCTGGAYNYAYPPGTRIVDTSSDGTSAGPVAKNTDCYDVRTTTPGVTGATKGTDLNFNTGLNDLATNGNPLCITALFYLQEQTPAITSATLTGTSNGGSAPFTVNGSTTSLSISGGITGAIKTGDTLIVSDATVKSQSSCTAGANYVTGATTITVSACSPNVTNFTASNTKVNDSYNYCWYGKFYTGDQSMCYAAVSSPFSGSSNGGGTVNSSTTSITVGSSGSYTGLNGNVRTGDSIVVSESGNSVTCTASASAYVNTIQIAITASSCTTTTGTGTAATYDTGATVTDSSTLTGSLNNDTNTISNFDTAHQYSGEISLQPLSANGTPNTTAPVWLAKHSSSGVGGDVRPFYVGVYVPAPNPSNQNALQGLSSTFGIKWHIDQ